jgi:hypothetical protein
MAESDWNPDTGGRSLAEILREAGIESANRAARRRTWDDPEETGIRQRRAEAAAAGRPELGRRKSDRSDEAPSVPERRAAPERRADSDRRPAEDPREMRRRPEPGPTTAAIPGMRPDRKPGVPVVGPLPSGPVQTRRTTEPPAQRSTQRPAQRATPAESHPQTGPIPVVRPEDIDDDLDASPRESALAWLRFAGELIIALAAGVGVYFAATVLWEMAPHVAVLLAPLAVTALVAGVGVWRQKQGREPVGPRLLAILVFAGTLLTIAPAAGLLAGGS